VKRNNNKEEEEGTTTSNAEVERKEDPKRFLSRLARGRTYKGNFRHLLQEIRRIKNTNRNRTTTYY